HTIFSRDWSSDVCSSDLALGLLPAERQHVLDFDAGHFAQLAEEVDVERHAAAGGELDVRVARRARDLRAQLRLEAGLAVQAELGIGSAAGGGGVEAGGW